MCRNRNAIFLNENICTCTRSACVCFIFPVHVRLSKIQNACHHQVYFEQLRQEKVAEPARETPSNPERNAY